MTSTYSSSSLYSSLCQNINPSLRLAARPLPPLGSRDAVSTFLPADRIEKRNWEHEYKVNDEFAAHPSPEVQQERRNEILSNPANSVSLFLSARLFSFTFPSFLINLVFRPSCFLPLPVSRSARSISPTLPTSFGSLEVELSMRSRPSSSSPSPPPCSRRRRTPPSLGRSLSFWVQEERERVKLSTPSPNGLSFARFRLPSFESLPPPRPLLRSSGGRFKDS